MHGHTRRLVDRQEVCVLEQYRELPSRGGGNMGPVGHAHRRQAHLVTGGDPGLGRRAPAVDPDLARANDPVDVGVRHPTQHAQQEVVQALAGRVLVDEEMTHQRWRGRVRGRNGHGFGPYTQGFQVGSQVLVSPGSLAGPCASDAESAVCLE